MKLTKLSKKLGYTFKNKDFLIQALTHCSVGSKNNERLEFVGDSIINFIIANALFTKFTQLPEGELSRLRANLVKGSTLAQIALELDISDALFLGQGELKSGGFRRASILADAFEAVIAAIYLDSNFDTCKDIVMKLYSQRLNDPNLLSNLKDAKTRLQEYLQSHQYTLPVYILNEITGAEHDQVFHVTCKVDSLKIKADAQGQTRRKAEQQAAKKILQQLKQN